MPSGHVCFPPSCINLPTGHSLTEGVIPAGGSRMVLDADSMSSTLACPAGGADCNVVAVMGDVAETAGSALAIEWEHSIRSQVSRGLLKRYYDGIRTRDDEDDGSVEAMSQSTVNVFFAASDRGNTAGRNALRHGVRELNRVLPSGRSVGVAGDLSGTPSIDDDDWSRKANVFLYYEPYELQNNIFYDGLVLRRGSILVYFASPERIREFLAPASDRSYSFFHHGYRGNERGIIVLPDTIDPEYRGSRGLHARVVLHELVHALGFHGHLNTEAWETLSLMNYEYAGFGGKLPQVDAAAVHFLYLDGEDGLGPWRDTGRYSLTGRSRDGVVNFRATYDDGVITAGWEGVGSLGRLADYHGVSGTAAWTGEMVGFHAARGVNGDVGLTVDLSRVYRGSHNLSFDDVRYQDDMALWEGDGELDYRVSIDDGGAFADANGEISGRFLGSEYQAMGGTVDRYNLAGAFGGSREE